MADPSLTKAEEEGKAEGEKFLNDLGLAPGSPASPPPTTKVVDPTPTGFTRQELDKAVKKAKDDLIDEIAKELQSEGIFDKDMSLPGQLGFCAFLKLRFKALQKERDLANVKLEKAALTMERAKKRIEDLEKRLPKS